MIKFLIKYCLANKQILSNDPFDVNLRFKFYNKLYFTSLNFLSQEDKNTYFKSSFFKELSKSFLSYSLTVYLKSSDENRMMGIIKRFYDL